MTNRQVLLIIATFVALTLGSFIWYIATWDSRKGGDQTTLIILPELLPPEAPALATGTKL
ncbi:hypothetical protein [Yoonia sp.]|uniref:hypothetical protein n=1 Tax=Yoonia sp. TaxID=2212373 RepID=UPI002E05F14E|nr:hypothetical protein [Yoonia sp.]